VPKKRQYISAPVGVAPSPSIFHINRSSYDIIDGPVGLNGDPKNLEREKSVLSQERMDEKTIIWGADDAAPLRMLNAVDQSPTATSCLDVVTDFITGEGFSDPDLMDLVIDKDGTTLWQLHCELARYMALLEGFAVNFKYNQNDKITQAYVLPLENTRFMAPGEHTKTIRRFKYNPYYGTVEFKQQFTTEYDEFDLKDIRAGMKRALNNPDENKRLYMGQVYYYGTTRPLYLFYPQPKYWSGKHWIYVDAYIQTFHKENLDNGFFQSALINVVGDPAEYSQNPEYMKKVTGTDGIDRFEPWKTVQQEFNDQMQKMFSGVKKAGTAMVLWAKNQEDSAKVSAFPVNTQFDVLSGTFTDAIRGITIATKVPAILANLPQQASSLGSDGEAFQKAVELMTSRTTKQRTTLEQFYNKILLPNLEENTKATVKIKDFHPVSNPVTMEDKFWEVLPIASKLKFVKDHIPGVEIDEAAITPAATTAPTVDEEGKPIEQPAPAQGNEALKALNMQQITRVQKIVKRYVLGELTYDQAKDFLLGYGITEAQIPNWLVTAEE
jgi:hypothetical protein